MSTVASERRLRFGTNCARCDNELIAPEWTECRNERQVHHVWHFCFETIVDIFPSPLVA